MASLPVCTAPRPGVDKAIARQMPSMANLYKSERLVYRAVEDSDEDRDFVYTLMSDPEVWTHISAGLPAPPNKKKAKEYLDDLVGPDASLAVIVCLPPTGKVEKDDGNNNDKDRPSGEKDTSTKPDQSASKPVPIGIVGLFRDGMKFAHHREATLVIELATKYHGQGYGTEAIKWATDWTFRYNGIHSLGLYVYGYNTAAMRLYERLGFVKEGVKREIHWFNGEWWDEVMYGMLEGEWRAIKEQGKWS